MNGDYSFDRHVSQIGRRRAIAFFVPRLIGLVFVGYTGWRFFQ